MEAPGLSRAGSDPPAGSTTVTGEHRPVMIPRARRADQPVRDATAASPAEPAVTPPPSATSPHRRRLRAWMLLAPVDVGALLTPLLLGTGYWRGIVTYSAAAVVLFAAGGLYRPRRHLAILDELPSLCGRLLAGAAIVGIIAVVRHDSVGYGAGFMKDVALAAAAVIAGRALSDKVVLVARRRRWVAHNAIVIGAGPIGTDLGRLLRRYPQYGLRFVGYVDAASRQDGPVLLLGTLDRLAEAIAVTGCQVLVVADPECPEMRLMQIMRQPGCTGCDLWVVPRLWGSRTMGSQADHIGAIPVVRIGRTTFSGPRWAIKRVSDVVFASTALVLLSPVLLLCALATLLDGGRGILFRQERIGRDGKPIRILKFRTMRPVDEAESRTTWSIARDRRVSRIGRFLRRTSLDELPQLWNILRGDMTVVGPRPERPYFVEKFSTEYPAYAMRHRVPVGLTGLAQVSGLRGDTPIADRARFDNYYIENWSLWLDIRVLLRTVTEVFRLRGN